MNDALVHCFLLDGKGGAALLTFDELLDWKPADGLLWVHVEYANQHARALLARIGVGESLTDLLTAPETRPRMLAVDDGILVYLRGVNTHPDADPEDMVSLRVWSDASRIVSARQRRVMAAQDLRAALERGDGPRDRSGFMVRLIDNLADRISAVVNDLEEVVEEVEADDGAAGVAGTRRVLAGVRRSAVAIRRYLAPQREALEALFRYSRDLFDEDALFELRENSDRMTRYVEDLDLLRERIMVLQDEAMNRLAEQQNTRMYALSIVATVFLPLSFISGVFGMNVAGLPGTNWPLAFVVLSAAMLVVGAAIVVALRWRRWL